MDDVDENAKDEAEKDTSKEIDEDALLAETDEITAEVSDKGDDLLDEDDILKSDDNGDNEDADLTSAEIEKMLGDPSEADDSKQKIAVDKEGKDSAIEDN